MFLASNRRRRAFVVPGLLLAFAAVVSLGGCDRISNLSAPQFRNIDITGADFGRSLALPDVDGRTRTLGDFKGKVTRAVLRLHPVSRRLPDDDGRAGGSEEDRWAPTATASRGSS